MSGVQIRWVGGGSCDNFGIFFFLFLHKNICCGYSFEVPCQGTSNEYPQDMLLWRTGENYPELSRNTPT